MSDDIDEQLTAWLKNRGAPDRTALDELNVHIAALPARRRRWSIVRFAAAAAIVVAAGLAALSIGVVPRHSGGAGQPSGPLPPDPAAFAGDPRLARCGASVETALNAFEMGRARDYHLYLPAMLLSPELDVDTPAFVVVFRDMRSFGGGAPPAIGQTEPPARSLPPGHHDLCILVGADPSTAEINAYADVDIAGLTANVVATDPTRTGDLSSPNSKPPTTSLPGADATTTPLPAPTWSSDLAGQLECSGTVSTIGGEMSDGVARDVPAGSPDDALAAFLAPPSPYGGLPTGGFTQIHAEAHWVSFGHRFGGGLKAILVASDLRLPVAPGPPGVPGWSIVGLRACDPSEFDPSIPLTYAITIWTDASGARVPTTLIFSGPGPGHCGWQSATFLWLADVTYVRDPEGLSGRWSMPHFDPAASLPAEARDRGFRSVSGALWTVPGGDAYLVSAGRVERWPRLDPTVGCT